MNTPTKKWCFPARATASSLFACLAIFLFGDCINVDTMLGSRFQNEVTDSVRRQLSLLSHDLHIVFRGLSIAAFVWCILSCRGIEPWFAKGISIFFVVLVLILNYLMS
jgi:hypothetical protein